jgi:hypothetical protein
MSTIRQSHEPVNVEARRFLLELEQEFDLMRLKARRASLEQEEKRLAEKQESLRSANQPTPSPCVPSTETPEQDARSARWWRAVATRVATWRLQMRREGIAMEMRRLALLEGDIEFALRLRRRRPRA